MNPNKSMKLLQAMNDLEDDMILEAAPEKADTSVPRHLFYRRWLPVFAAAAVMLVLVRIVPMFFRMGAADPDVKEMQDQSNYSSAARTEETEGAFTLEAPAEIAGGMALDPVWLEQDLVSIVYTDAQGLETAEVCKGTDAEEVRGGYEDYSEAFTEEINGMEVNFQGQDGVVMLAVWTDGTYTYSLYVEEGMNLEEIRQLVPLIH
jgi:hypothetical protein